ncbi:MAG: hypothetical protein WBC03_14320 [Albidovulum sp.]
MVRRCWVVILAGSMLGPAAAQDWSIFEGEHETALSNCSAHDGSLAESCVELLCFWDGQFQISLELKAARVPPQAKAVIALDGTPTFVDLTGTGQPLNFSTPVTGKTFVAMMDSMARARQMSVMLDAPALNLPALQSIPMSGFAPRMAAFRDNCVDPLMLTMQGAPASLPPAPAPTPEATPATDPARFPTTASLADTGPAVVDLAHRLLAREIAEAEAGAGRGIEVRPELVRFADGRQLLEVLLCDPTWFGITGCETHIFTAQSPEAPFAASISGLIGGGPYWLDLTVGAGGWPDILSQPHTGGGSFARMRWTGSRYDICPQGLC